MVKEYREAEQKHTGYSRCAIPTFCRRWCFWCGWHMAGPRDGRNRERSSIFCSASFLRRSPALATAGKSPQAASSFPKRCLRITPRILPYRCPAARHPAILWPSRSVTDAAPAGAISASGSSTNRRSCMAGCGMVSSAGSTIESPNSRMSMSIFRGPCLWMRGVGPWLARSPGCASAAPAGVFSVSRETAQFRNHGCAVNSTGSVS